MHVGYNAAFQNPFDGLSDLEVYQHELALCDLAVELVVELARPQQAVDSRQGDGKPGAHGRHLSASFSMRMMTVEIRSQFSACAASCFRPAFVMA